MPSAPEVASANRERVLFTIAVALSLFAVLGVQYVPLLDFPEHALMAHVVARQAYDAGPDYHGHLVLRSLWAPYSFLYLLALPLTTFMSAAWALKLWLAASLAGTAFALRWLLRSLSRDPYAFYFAFPFVFSTVYLAGFITYLLGISAALLLVGMVLRKPQTTARNFIPRLAMQFLLLWAHPLLYAAMSAVLVLILLVMVRAGKISARNWFASLAWLALPALYLVILAPSLVGSREITWRFKIQHWKLFFFNLGAYHLRVFNDPFWLPKIPLLAWILWAAVKYAGARNALPQPSTNDPAADSEKALWARALALSVALLILFALVLPEWVSGLMVTASFRLTPVALLLAAALLPEQVTRPRTARLLLVTWCLGVLLANALLSWRFDRQMDGFVSVSRRMEPGQTTVMLFEGEENVLFHHALSYYHIEKGGISPKTFLTVPNVKHMPAELTPPFPWGDADWDKSVSGPLVEPAGRAFRYVLVKTSRADSEPLPAFQPPNHHLAARAGGWLLFERNRN